MKFIIAVLLLFNTGCYMHTTHHITLDHNIKVDLNSAPVHLTIKHRFEDSNLTEEQKIVLAKEAANKTLIPLKHDTKN